MENDQPGMPYVIGDDELRPPRCTPSSAGAGAPEASRSGAERTFARGMSFRYGAVPLVLGQNSALGSNNWVIWGARAASGKPILANDIHLTIQMPSIWYEVALHGVAADGRVERTAECPFQLRGFSFY